MQRKIHWRQHRWDNGSICPINLSFFVNSIVPANHRMSFPNVLVILISNTKWCSESTESKTCFVSSLGGKWGSHVQTFVLLHTCPGLFEHCTDLVTIHYTKCMSSLLKPQGTRQCSYPVSLDYVFTSDLTRKNISACLHSPLLLLGDTCTWVVTHID